MATSHINRRAKYDYEFIETWTAGMSLTGTEVKSVKQFGVNFEGSWCEVKEDRIIVKHLSIPEVPGAFTHKSTQDRQLLLTNKEIKKINRMMDKGLSVIPVSIFTNTRGLLKIQIALAKGKKNYDKRETIKKRDLAREAVTS